MLAYINNRLHFINRTEKPVIIIYGSSDERSTEISKKINRHTYHIQTVYADDELPDIIKIMHPILVVIGGRCKPETRLLIRYFARQSNDAVLFSEPGIQYENSAAAVIKDVLYKIKCIMSNKRNRTNILNTIN